MKSQLQFLKQFEPLRGKAALKKIAGDRVLFLQTTKEQKTFPCKMLAVYFLHAAQDGGFSEICVLKGPNHKHMFKVYDLVRDNFRRYRARNRAWTGPALQSFKLRKDCWMDERKKVWQVGWQPKPNAKIEVATR